MNYHQSNVFLQDLSNSFIFGSTFQIVIPECLNNSWWCFSLSFSNFEDRRRVPLKSCPFFQRFMVLALCHPLIIVFDCENSFQLSGANSRVFSISYPESIFSNIIHSQLSAHVLQFYRCFVQVIFNQLVISSFSWV